MKLSSLSKLFAGHISAATLSAEIAEELAAHTRQLERKGASAPVMVTEDCDICLDRAGLSVLCTLFASGELTAAELSYTADVLQLSDRVSFGSDSIASDLAECTDPEINGPFTASRALDIAASGNAV